MSFLDSQLYCVLDYETYSEADLKKVGAFEYSKHQSTEIICVAWKFGTRETIRESPTCYWAPSISDKDSLSDFSGFLSALRNPNIVLVAHNAFFEQAITKNVFAEKYMPSMRDQLQIPPQRWLCTASLAASLAVPRNLEGAALALKLPVQKDMEGRRLTLKWCKPRKPSKNDPSTRHSDPEEFSKIVAYCMKDVDAETELFLKCPPLTPTERRVWELDQEINFRGFEVDRSLVKTILGMISEETKILNKETKELSNGQFASATQRAQVLSWLESENVFLPDLQKKTVEDALKEGLVEEDAKRMLEIRLAISKTSTAKYQAFEQRSRCGSRVRDMLVYHTASTGRWGGSGVQPQNFPRGNLKDSVQAAEILRSGDLELVRLLYGDPMNVFSSCLRSMIVAPEDHVLDVGDYASIEVRVLFWLARHEAGIKAYLEDRDLYVELAKVIYGPHITKANAFERLVAKHAVLGCGYNMGWKKFMATCEKFGVIVSEELAQTAVKAYRTTHAPVVKLWDVLNRAAIAAVQNPKKRYTVNRTTWFVEKEFLFCQLPSGRRLAYYGPTVRYDTTPWGDKRPVLYHWGVNPLSKKWENASTYGGKLTENVVQAISRDLMAEAMLRIEAAGPWKIVLSVHDELVAERKLSGEGTSEEFLALMEELPSWAQGCPVKVEGWEGARYRK